MELVFSNALTHGSRTANTARHHLEHLINVVRAAPFLVFDDIDPVIHLGLLDQLAVRPHALLAVRLGELVADERRGVQTGQRDKLPAVAQLGKAADIRLLFRTGHGRLPVERGGEVVGESE